MVSVNGNNKATEKQIEDTYLQAREIIEAGGTIIMDSTEDANSPWNASGEALVQEQLGEPTGQTSKGYNYWGSNPEYTSKISNTTSATNIPQNSSLNIELSNTLLDEWKTLPVYSDRGVNTMMTENKESEFAHFGNPWSEGEYQEAIKNYKDWLLGNFNQNVQGENITSKGSEFAKKLTNVGNTVGLVYKGKQYVNSEHVYQTWKSGEFNQQGYSLKGNKVRGGKIGDTFSIMVDIITEKLKQNPELIQGINERGGLDYIQKSTHTVIGDKFWETSGQNQFINALYQAAVNVGITSKNNIDINPEQRKWILEQINSGKLDNATLLYSKKLADRGLGSHAEALKEVVELLRGNEFDTGLSTESFACE